MEKESYLPLEDQYYIQATAAIMESQSTVLKDGNVFSVSDKFGDIRSYGNTPLGIYLEGTRFLSKIEMLINDQVPFLLSSGLNEENEMHTVDLTNPDILDHGSSIIEKGNIQIQRKIFIWKKVCYHSIKLCNFAVKNASFKLSFLFDADFKDIFQIRGIKRKYHGEKLPNEITNNEIVFHYLGADSIHRSSRILFNTNPELIENDKVEFHITLEPKECKDLYISIAFEIDNDRPEILTTDVAYLEMISRMTNIKNSGPKIQSSDNQFDQWVTRSKSDLFTLTTEMETGIYPYAGIPWYNTPFGRDGIITALQTLWIYPDLGKNVLKFLALHQATNHNEETDAQPGKIFHEQRKGEMANTGEIPFKMYYGSIDSTPLFIMLASKYYHRTGDIDFIREIWPNLEAALNWMDEYGDVDGDGFIEYERKLESGLLNQGWKDSYDSIFHEDGMLAEKPIALCEVQGYAYAAKLGMAKLFKILGNTEKASILINQAEQLKENFSNAFWSEEKQTYVIALDGNKKQCNVASSNAGHCLFTGIAKIEEAKKIAKTLLSTKMFSGWGIRTIAKKEIRYNPMSYHNGSIWPHDNAIIALGFANYGLMEEVKTITNAIFDSTLHFESQRLPELFCGFDRVKNISITRYPVACSPQAWAAGCVYQFIEACLQIKIRPEENTIYFENSVLPAFIDELTIIHIPYKNETISIKIQVLNGVFNAEIISPNNYQTKIKLQTF
jgi:glycogen debranching enzyme